MAAQRVIFHCDCNSFYASVELLTRPELKNVPVAVCGNPQHRHGIILAKNEAAKKYGIQTAETVASARRKCPQLALLPPHHELYRAYSKQVNAIYARYTEFVEPFGIDESWLDMTASWHLFGPSPVAVAHRIRREVKAQTGLTISVGVSFTKAFAKLGSDYKKPDAVTEFSLENYRQLVWPLPVEALLYVGHSARQTLGKLGITTIGQLAAASPQVLEAALGKLGMELWGFARGEEGSLVRSMYEKREVKSVGNGLTFPRDLTTLADARAGLVALSDEVASRLRAHGLYAGAVQITVKDAGFKTITRQAQLATPTHLAKDIAAAALTLLQQNWRFPAPIRMLTVTALNVSHSAAAQLSLFAPEAGQEDVRRENLEKSLDSIRGKFGKSAIASASALRADMGLGGLKIKENRKKGE